MLDTRSRPIVLPAEGAFMTEYYDDLETRAPAQRETALLAALPGHIAHAQRNAPAFADILQGVDAAGITSRAALATLPVTRKSELLARQQKLRASDPFGGFAAVARGPGMQRIFASPGPIYEPEGRARDYWRAARALHAAGLRAGDLVHNAFSYHMTPGAYILESGAMALGCTVFPAGTGQTEQQLQAIAELRPSAYTGTPSFLRILIEKAREAQAPFSIRKASVGGGLVLDEGVILEIVRPGTGEPVADGEVGEVVVTVLNPDYPLIRFGTGDLSAILPGACPTGRTNTRIRGWMGRADQTTKVRGMFVHPGQIAEVVQRFAEVKRARLRVSGEMANDQMTLQVEATEVQGLAEKIAEALRDVTKLRGDIQFVPVGSLPNDGKVIDDTRSYK
jgi:phenylacetate-CoA ligase